MVISMTFEQIRPRFLAISFVRCWKSRPTVCEVPLPGHEIMTSEGLAGKFSASHPGNASRRGSQICKLHIGKIIILGTMMQ